MKTLLMQAIRKGAKVYIADFKGGVDFPKMWRKNCRMCFTEADLLYTLDQLVTVLHGRKELLEKSECQSLDEYNQATGADIPRLVFACDEVAEVLDRTGRSKEEKETIGKIESKLATIARLGRAFGIHLILSTQRPDVNVIPRPDQEQPGLPGLRQGGNYSFTNHSGQWLRSRADPQGRKRPVHYRGWHRVPGLLYGKPIRINFCYLNTLIPNAGNGGESKLAPASFEGRKRMEQGILLAYLLQLNRYALEKELITNEI